MSEKPGGIFSTFGRFFTGKKIDKDSDKSASSSPVSPKPSSSPRSSYAGSSFLKDIISVDKTRSSIESSSKNLANSSRYSPPSSLIPKHRRPEDSLFEINMDPIIDIFSSPSIEIPSRKRQLTETDKSLLPQSFRTESVKRTRFPGNRSLLEPSLVSKLGSPKLDTTWCGQFSSGHSPTSSVTGRSLLSHRSGRVSNGSNLSSTTQHCFRKLEQANTPAKEVQRMTSIRAGLARPEKWAPSNTSFSSDAPPLRKAGDNIPSRIQLLSKSMAHSSQRKPYWRDLTRKRSEPKSSDITNASVVSTRTNGSNHSTELSSLFSNNDKDDGKKVESVAKKHQATVKGVDGKAVGKNTFKLVDEDVDEEVVPISKSWLSNTKPLVLETANVPKSGFLGTLSFTFAPPVDLVPVANTVVTPVSGSDEDANEESSNDDKDYESEKDTSSKSSSDTEETSDEIESSDKSLSSEAKSADESKKDTTKTVESRPHTSTDTVSPAVSIDSSKNNSPKVSIVRTVETKTTDVKEKKEASSTWTCNGCFTSWPSTSNECGCCGAVKGGASASSAPAQKQLVSNLSSFGSSKPSGVTFGFGASAPAVKSDSAFGSTTATTKSLFATGLTPTITITKPSESTIPTSIAPSFPSTNLAPAPAPVAEAAPASSAPSAGDRVAWDCPECMVNNKATEDKCVCCGHVMYKSADSSSSNVFGNRAFKPSSNNAISFGLSSTGTAPKFGFGASSAQPTDKNEPIKPAAAPISFGITAPPTSEPAKTGSLFGLPKVADTEEKKLAPSMFGNGGSLFGASKSEAAPVAVAVSEPAKPSLFASSSLEKKDSTIFGSSLSAFSTAPALAPTASTVTSTNTTTNPPSSIGFGSGSLFSAPVSAPKLAASLTPQSSSFGQTSVDASKPAGGLFGNILSSGSSVAPPTSAAPVTSTASLFGAGSSTSSIFGNLTSGSLFGSDAGSTTTDGVPAKKGMFSSLETKAPTLTFEMNKPAVSAAPAPSAPFSFPQTATNPAAPATNMFGSSTSSMFSGFGSSTATPFGANPSATSSFAAPAPALSFGGAPSSSLGSFGSFGGSSSIPPLQPTISNSSSTSSLFSLNPAPPSTDMSNPFQVTGMSNGFTFGASAPTNPDGVFKFGSTAPPPALPTANGPAFQFGAAPSTGGAENLFAYQPPSQNAAAGGRKMAMARRRNVRK